jgi:hypothetical protein
VRDGDWLEVAGPPDSLGRWDVSKVANLTTGSTVIMVGGRRSKAALVATMVVLGVGVLLILLVGVGVVVALAGS